VTARTHRQGAGVVRLLGVALVLGGLLLLIGYTAATIRELALLEAAFGEHATGEGRDAMLPGLLIADGIALGAIVAGIVLLVVDRRHRRDAAGPEVRDLAADEVGAASAVVVAAYRDLLGDELDEGYAAVVADVADRMERAEVLVAVADDRVVGCITYVPGPGPYAEFTDDDAAGIRMLAVAPEAQGRGVGVALVRACVQRARASGRARIVLHSTEPMVGAQRLYEREGFVRAPERDWQPQPGPHLIGYERTL
jgi:ribosomal protein S18 acetylase RimI-like enzyme